MEQVGHYGIAYVLVLPTSPSWSRAYDRRMNGAALCKLPMRSCAEYSNASRPPPRKKTCTTILTIVWAGALLSLPNKHNNSVSAASRRMTTMNSEPPFAPWAAAVAQARPAVAGTRSPFTRSAPRHPPYRRRRLQPLRRTTTSTWAATVIAARTAFFLEPAPRASVR